MSLSNRPPRRDPRYSIEEIREIASPIAGRFGVDRMWLFGSYSPFGDINPDSDLEFRLDKSEIGGYFQLGGFHNALGEAFGMKIDLVETDSLEDDFLDLIAYDKVVIYERHT